MSTTEQRVHQAITHLAAALDWGEKARREPRYTVSVDFEVRAAIQQLQDCWGVCEDCGDRWWKEMLAWNPGGGVPDLRTGGYTGAVQCQPCRRRWENGEPSQADIEGRAEAHAARLAHADTLLRDAGRAES